MSTFFFSFSLIKSMLDHSTQVCNAIGLLSTTAVLTPSHLTNHLTNLPPPPQLPFSCSYRFILFNDPAVNPYEHWCGAGSWSLAHCLSACLLLCYCLETGSLTCQIVQAVWSASPRKQSVSASIQLRIQGHTTTLGPFTWI